MMNHKETRKVIEDLTGYIASYAKPEYRWLSEHDAINAVAANTVAAARRCLKRPKTAAQQDAACHIIQDLMDILDAYALQDDSYLSYQAQEVVYAAKMFLAKLEVHRSRRAHRQSLSSR